MAREQFHSPIPKGIAPEHTAKAARAYRRLYDGRQGGTSDQRRRQYETLVNTYYNLTTDFYEYGWGQSFHFGVRKRGQSQKSAIRAQEHFIGERLRLTPHMRVLDVGCGVGGPMRELARRFGCVITGLNNNAYQLTKCANYNKAAGLQQHCDTLKADFMSIPVPENSYDAIYAIEATCHAPDRTAVFRELLRVLKPGGCFAAYEWCTTDKFDSNDPEHQKIKRGIEEGDALPDILSTTEVLTALERAGFTISEQEDRALACDPETPWYRTLEGREVSLAALPRLKPVRWLSHRTVGLLERLGLAPTGTQEVSAFLNTAADSLVAGGRLGIFTPMFFFVAQKPRG